MSANRAEYQRLYMRRYRAKVAAGEATAAAAPAPMIKPDLETVRSVMDILASAARLRAIGVHRKRKE